jgi:hypothetical protein
MIDEPLLKVENMTSSKGNKVANQFIIHFSGDILHERVFQSYDTVIVKICFDKEGNKFIYLDRNKWDCSVTTGKYRNQFLGETKAETLKKIKSGEYILTDLN